MVLQQEIVSYDTLQQLKPTNEQFGKYQGLFDYFNDTLFEGQLPPIILNFSRKGKNVGGFFAPERWLDKEAVVHHEISLNPDHWNQETNHMLSVLVHEMVHLWQQVFGKPARRGYHDKEWGAKMKAVGLYPSNTGKVGGKETGQQMTHYVIEHGRYEFALADMPKELLLPFTSAPIPPTISKAKAKIKYTCPSCEAKVWGKDGLHVTCADCGEEFEIAD